jgi:hypothetical protein
MGRLNILLLYCPVLSLFTNYIYVIQSLCKVQSCAPNKKFIQFWFDFLECLLFECHHTHRWWNRTIERLSSQKVGNDLFLETLLLFQIKQITYWPTKRANKVIDYSSNLSLKWDNTYSFGLIWTSSSR